MKIIEQWGKVYSPYYERVPGIWPQDPELIDFDGDFRINLYRTQATQDATQVTQVTTQATPSYYPQVTKIDLSDDVAVLTALVTIPVSHTERNGGIIGLGNKSCEILYK